MRHFPESSSHKMFATNLQTNSKKLFILKLIVQEIENQMTETIGSLETAPTKELEFLAEMLSKYEGKLDTVVLGDRFLVQSEVEKLTDMMESLNISQ